jgi:hypothetical protein
LVKNNEIKVVEVARKRGSATMPRGHEIGPYLRYRVNVKRALRPKGTMVNLAHGYVISALRLHLATKFVDLPLLSENRT